MNGYPFNPAAPRLAKARAGRLVPSALATLLGAAAVLLLVSGSVLAVLGRHPGFSLIGLALMFATALVWIKRDLGTLPAAPIGSTHQLDALLPLELAGRYQAGLAPAEFWQILASTWEGRFIIMRFGLDPAAVAATLTSAPINFDQLWAQAEQVSADLGLPTLEVSTIIAALFTTCEPLGTYLTKLKLTPAELNLGARWARRVVELTHIQRPIYGGLARDWASGYTPQLARFGTNLSQSIEMSGGSLATQERTEQLDDLVIGLDSATGSVVLVGELGIGKSALLLGLAERLLQGRTSRSLSHYQIYSLSASSILAESQGPGDIERTVIALLSEAAHAGNIIIALDEAQLFFGQGTGAVNLSQVLLPVLQSHSTKLVLTLTPGDWQRIKATNAAMTSLLTPLVLSEPGQPDVIHELADRALFFEQGRFVTTYNALIEAYRLSGRYLQDEAYPGKALKLLEAAYNHPDGQFVTATSVEQAVESQFGVKVQQASSAESDVLLHLEDKIHQRMINQTRAVSVVANALRRARAGVANPKRPIGSFLFLGPTGVGKTELARSIAAIYFGNEANIIRLDMSEYQQIADVDRILESASTNPSGLLPRVRQAPFSVVLFDEIEKAHPNILNLLLQLLDEGNLTDITSHPASFKDAIIITTSNAGAEDIRQRIQAGEALESFEQEFVNGLIDAGAFRPELLNRFDEIVLFRPLNEAELAQVVHLMIDEVNQTLEPQKIAVALTAAAAAELVTAGYDPRLGARPMRRMVQRRVEDTVAAMILRGEAQPGDTITLDAGQLSPPSEPALETQPPAPAPEPIEPAPTDEQSATADPEAPPPDQAPQV